MNDERKQAFACRVSCKAMDVILNNLSYEHDYGILIELIRHY